MRTTTPTECHRCESRSQRQRRPAPQFARAVRAVGVPPTLEVLLSLNTLTRKVYSVQLLRLLIAFDIPVPASFHVSPNSAAPVCCWYS